MKEKFILPINFLKHWPPDALAIQFATTQFLPWKTKEEFEEDTTNLESARTNEVTHWDITRWDDKFVFRTAKQINELIKKRSLEKVYLNDELSIHDHNATGEEDNTTNDELQINSLENSIEDQTELNGRKEDHLKGDDLVKVRIDNEQVDSRTPSIKDVKAMIKTDQVDHQQKHSVPLTSLVSLSAFSLPPLNSAPVNKLNSSVSSPDFTENALTIKSGKRSNCEANKTSIKFTKRAFEQTEVKKLIAISAHPAQRAVVDSLRAKLSPHYNVWSSTDMIHSYSRYNSATSTLNAECKFDFDQFSTSLNSLSSSVTNSVDTDLEINDSANLSVQNFPQALAKPYGDPLTKLDRSTSIDINGSNQTISSSRVEKQSSRFDKCFYRNQIAKSIGKSQWYVDSPDPNSQSCVLQPDEIDKVNIFKEKVNEARAVIILLSEDYCDSRTSKRQAYYCDFRYVNLIYRISINE